MDDDILDALNRSPDQIGEIELERIIAFYRRAASDFSQGVKPKKEGVDEKNLKSVLGIRPLVEEDRRE